MKIGSKLAIYKLEEYETKKGQKFYKATLIENILNTKCPYYNKWETHMFQTLIFTEKELEIANFDIDIPDEEVEIETKKGKFTYTKKTNKLSFDRISNPKHSIIRVLEFEINKNYAYQGKDKMKMLNSNKDKVNEVIIIQKCEYDCVGWCVPEKQFDKQVNYYKKQHEKRKTATRELRSELTKANAKIKRLESKIEQLKSKPKQCVKRQPIVKNKPISKPKIKKEKVKPKNNMEMFCFEED